MQIGRVAEHSGVPTKTIRFFEKIGIIAKPERTPSGYRERKMAELESIWRTLFHLADKCDGDERPEYLMLQELAYGPKGL